MPPQEHLKFVATILLQAAAANRLSGDDFRALREEAPMLAWRIASNVVHNQAGRMETIAAAQKLADEGKITPRELWGII